jgi:hypothetical protein
MDSHVPWASVVADGPVGEGFKQALIFAESLKELERARSRGSEAAIPPFPSWALPSIATLLRAFPALSAHSALARFYPYLYADLGLPRPSVEALRTIAERLGIGASSSGGGPYRLVGVRGERPGEGGEATAAFAGPAGDVVEVPVETGQMPPSTAPLPAYCETENIQGVLASLVQDHVTGK